MFVTVLIHVRVLQRRHVRLVKMRWDGRLEKDGEVHSFIVKTGTLHFAHDKYRIANVFNIRNFFIRSVINIVIYDI